MGRLLAQRWSDRVDGDSGGDAGTVDVDVDIDVAVAYSRDVFGKDSI